MTTAALDAQGTLLQIGDGAGSELFTTIAGVTSISPFQGSAAERDVTDLSATDYRQFKKGLRDLGTSSFTVQWMPDNAQHALLWTGQADRAARNFKLSLTDSTTTTYAFSAYVQTVQLGGIDVDGTVTATVSLRHTGAITLS